MVKIVRRRLTAEMAAHVTREVACDFRGSRRRVVCGSALIPWAGAQERLYFLLRGDIYSANENVGKQRRGEMAPTLESIGVWIPYRTFATIPYKAGEKIAAHNPSTSVERSEDSIEEAYEVGKTHHTPGFTGWDRDDRPTYIASTLHFADPGTGITESKRWWGPGMGWVHLDDMTLMTKAATGDPDSTNVNPVACSAELETCLRQRLHVAFLGGHDANLDGQRQIQFECTDQDPQEVSLSEERTALPSTTTVPPRPRYIRMPNLAYQAAVADHAARGLECLIRVLVVPKQQEASVWWLQNNLEWSAENFVWMSSMVRFTTVALNSPCLVVALPPITLPSDRGYLFGVWLPQVPYIAPYSRTLTSKEAHRLLRQLAWKIHAALDQDRYAVRDGEAPFHVVTPRPSDCEDQESEDEDEDMDEDRDGLETLDVQPSGNALFDEV